MLKWGSPTRWTFKFLLYMSWGRLPRKGPMPPMVQKSSWGKKTLEWRWVSQNVRGRVNNVQEGVGAATGRLAIPEARLPGPMVDSRLPAAASCYFNVHITNHQRYLAWKITQSRLISSEGNSVWRRRQRMAHWKTRGRKSRSAQLWEKEELSDQSSGTHRPSWGLGQMSKLQDKLG